MLPIDAAHDPQRGSLGASLAHAVSDQRPVGRGVEPVDRHGGVVAGGGWVGEHDRRPRIIESARHQTRLLRALLTLEQDDPFPTHLGGEHHR